MLMVMNPNSPLAPPPSGQQGPDRSNPYDFLSESPKKSSGFSFMNNRSKKARIITVSVGAIILAMIAFIVVGLLTSAGKADTVSLINAAKQQNELIRIADIGTQKARGQEAKNLAVTTKLTLQSQQSEMIGAVKMKNKKFGTKDLAISSSKQNNELLTAAEQSNRFDEEFLDLMRKELINYQQTVEKAYKGAEGTQLKAALLSQYESANILVGKADQTD